MKESINNSNLEKIFSDFDGIEDIKNYLGCEFEEFQKLILSETSTVGNALIARTKSICEFNIQNLELNELTIMYLNEIKDSSEFINIIIFLLPEFSYLIQEFFVDTLLFNLVEYYLENNFPI